MAKPSNIRICPECNEKYVVTPESPDKCLFCLRGKQYNKNIYYVVDIVQTSSSLSIVEISYETKIKDDEEIEQ